MRGKVSLACKRCEGSGQVTLYHVMRGNEKVTCPKCRGAGIVLIERTYKIE